jgi:hypothetical protein
VIVEESTLLAAHRGLVGLSNFQVGSPKDCAENRAVPMTHLRFPFFIRAGLGSVSVKGVMDRGINFVTSTFQHDDPITLDARSHEHSLIDRIQHLTSHKVLGNCDDLGSSP